MARPKRTIDERIDALSEWDEDHVHRIWHGAMRRGHPEMNGIHHPVRHLLGIGRERQHVAIRIKRTCDEPRCINENHFDVVVGVSKMEGFKPPWLDRREALPTTGTNTARSTSSSPTSRSSTKSNVE